ncbi:MAG: radical SAM protein [Bacillota bacterium]
MKMVSWNITKRCNLYCQHCYRESGPEIDTSDELTTEEGYQLIDGLAEQGFRLLILSGGEPLLRDDLDSLISYAAEKGLYPVLGTNALDLTADRIVRLKDAGLKGMGISLDSASPEIHDNFRGQEGAWKRTVKSIKLVRKYEIPVQINTTISEQNFFELDGIIELAEKLGVRAVHPFFLVPTGRGKEIEEDSLRGKKYQEMIEAILDKSKEVEIELKPTCAPQFLPLAKERGMEMRFSRGCLAGVSYCCILPEGEVHICPYLPLAAGDLREKSFEEIWQNSEVFENLRDYNKYEGKCEGCKYLEICGGCRARAYYYSDGNYLAGDPWCGVRTDE